MGGEEDTEQEGGKKERQEGRGGQKWKEEIIRLREKPGKGRENKESTRDRRVQ